MNRFIYDSVVPYVGERGLPSSKNIGMFFVKGQVFVIIEACRRDRAVPRQCSVQFSGRLALVVPQ